MKKLQNSLILIFLSFYLMACASTQNINLIKEKAELGDKESQYKLGRYYQYNKKDLTKAFLLYTKSANQNYPVAQNELGNCYMEGTCIAKDDKKAFYWYEKASKSNYFDAINNLGYMYDLGLGIKEDNKKALQLYEDAASRGSIRALFNLGLLHKYGQGTPKNNIQAYKWFIIARNHTWSSKNISFKWSIRKQLDELRTMMTKQEINESVELANRWISEISKKYKEK